MEIADRAGRYEGKLLMKFWVCVVAVFLHVAGGGSALAARAMWVWSEANQLLDNRADRAYAFDFMRRNGVDTLYLWTDADGRLLLEPQKYHRLIGQAHARGIQVYALDGDPSYVVPGPARDRAMARFQHVLDYNANSTAAQRFDGVNLDVEPWGLPDWQTNQGLRIQQYLDLSAEYMQLKQNAGSDIPVGPDMAFWFDTLGDIDWNGQTKGLHEHVLDVFDYGTLLDYRDFAIGLDGMVFHATTELDYAQSIGKPLVLGVETQANVGPDKVTFHEEGAVYMEQQLDLVEAAFAANPSFQGFAIHHYGSYLELDGVRLPEKLAMPEQRRSVTPEPTVATPSAADGDPRLVGGSPSEIALPSAWLGFARQKLDPGNFAGILGRSTRTCWSRCHICRRANDAEEKESGKESQGPETSLGGSENGDDRRRCGGVNSCGGRGRRRLCRQSAREPERARRSGLDRYLGCGRLQRR